MVSKLLSIRIEFVIRYIFPPCKSCIHYIKNPSPHQGREVFPRCHPCWCLKHPLEGYNVTTAIKDCFQVGFKIVLGWFTAPTSSLHQLAISTFPFINNCLFTFLIHSYKKLCNFLLRIKQVCDRLYYSPGTFASSLSEKPRVYQPRSCILSSGLMLLISIPTIASPRSRDTSANTSGS